MQLEEYKYKNIHKIIKMNSVVFEGMQTSERSIEVNHALYKSQMHNVRFEFSILSTYFMLLYFHAVKEDIAYYHLKLILNKK